jgi:Trk K+ transport system NAD-binding subunit
MRITIIGSGNVATHLAAAFKNAGHRIAQVYSRNYAQCFAVSLSCRC